MTIYYIVGGVIALAVLIGALLTKRPFRALLTSALQGICALAAVNVMSMFTGVTLGLTVFSLLVCAVLGLPGTITLLVLQVLL